MIVGLCIDNVNHPDETPARIRTWCEEIKKEIVRERISTVLKKYVRKCENVLTV